MKLVHRSPNTGLDSTTSVLRRWTASVPTASTSGSAWRQGRRVNRSLPNTGRDIYIYIYLYIYIYREREQHSGRKGKGGEGEDTRDCYVCISRLIYMYPKVIYLAFTLVVSPRLVSYPPPPWPAAQPVPPPPAASAPPRCGSDPRPHRQRRHGRSQPRAPS